MVLLPRSANDVQPRRRRRRRRLADDLQDATERGADDIELPLGIYSKRADVTQLIEAAKLVCVLDQVGSSRLAVRRIHGQSDRPHPALNEIRKEVSSPKRCAERAATVDEPPGNRLTGIPVVLVDRIDQREISRRGGREVVARAFGVAPAIVSPTTPRRLVVDFLESVLADIADDEGAGPTAVGV